MANINNLESIRLSTDFRFFCRWSGPDPITNNEILITEEHLRLVKMLMLGRDYVVVAYRGFGKSTLVTHKYLMRRATQHHKSSIIFSATEDLAVDKLKLIKLAFESDPHLNRYCAKGIFTWTDKEIWITDKENTRTTDDGKTIYPIISRIKALGFDSKFRGLHYDIIDCDDIVVEENTLTPEGNPDIVKIEQVKKMFNSKVVPLRNPGGNILLVGTPQYWDVNNVKDSDLLYDWVNRKNKEAYLLPALNEMGDPTVPELHSKEFLDDQRGSMSGDSWDKEYMLQPRMSGETIVDENMLIKCLDDSRRYMLDYVPKIDEIVFIGTDYSVIDDKMEAERKDSCYFAMVALAYNVETSKRRILNLHYERGISFGEQLNKTMNWINRYNARVLCLESHGGMRYFLNELQKMVPPGVSIEDASNKAGKFDTYSGLPSLLYVFEKELISLANLDSDDKEKNKFLLYELKYMKAAGHVDLLDALLRIDLVIRSHYHIAKHNPTYSVRPMKQDKNEMSELDKEALRVFGDDYDPDKAKELFQQRQKERLASGDRTVPDEDIKIILERTR